MLVGLKNTELVYKYLVCIFLLSFPWAINVSTWGAVVFSLSVLLLDYRQRVRAAEHLLLIVFYLYCAVSYMIHSDSAASNFYLTSSPFLIVPFIMGMKRTGAENRDKSFFSLVFAAGTSLAMLVMLSIALYKFRGNDFYLFLNGYEPVTYLIGIHPSYLSLFVAFSFVVVASELSTNYRRLTFSYRLLFLVWLIFLAFGVFYIRSRLMVLSFIILVPVIIFLALPKRRRMMITIVFMSVLIAGYYIVRVTDFHIGRFEFRQVMRGIELKRAQWTAAWEVISEYPLFGVTESRSHEELNKRYAAMGFSEGIEQKYNSHNQFLTTLVEWGIIGLMLLFTPLVMLAYRSIQHNDVAVIGFCLLTVLAFSTESMLVRQKGLIYYTVFVSLFANTLRNANIGPAGVIAPTVNEK